MGEGDTLVVWKLDRLGRSLPHLIELITSLAEQCVCFQSLFFTVTVTTALSCYTSA